MKLFDLARKRFYGKKRGLETEYANFVYHCKHPLRNYPVLDPKEIIPLLLPAIESQIKTRNRDRGNKFVPPPKNFQTWINNRCWEETSPQPKIGKPARSIICICGQTATTYILDKQGKATPLCRACKKKGE